MGQEGSLPSQPQLGQHTLDSIAALIKGENAKKIVVMTGAGISTSAGIPDFRSPRTGLYANLKRLNLPYPEAVFDISYFREQPEPFYVLAREIYPGKYHPTLSHVFISLLARRGLLLKLFTQNIDCLERAAGVPSDLIVEAHGSFATQRCIDCKTPYPDDRMKEHVEKGSVPRCAKGTCSGLVKPDIVFFGEGLPSSFSASADVVPQADLVIILGTSLSVYPFAALPEMASRGAPRLLLNWERVGSLGTRPFDVVELGPCDYGVRKLAEELGWMDELEKLWRETVGEEEADKQLKRQMMHGDDLQERDDEIIEAIAKNVAELHLEDGGEGEGGEAGSSKGKGEEAESSGETRDEGVEDKPQEPVRKGEVGENQDPEAPEPSTSQERMAHLAGHIQQKTQASENKTEGTHASEVKSKGDGPAKIETPVPSEPAEPIPADTKSSEAVEAKPTETLEKASADKTSEIASYEAPKVEEETVMTSK